MFIAFDPVILILEKKYRQMYKNYYKMFFTVYLTTAKQNRLNYLQIEKRLNFDTSIGTHTQL